MLQTMQISGLGLQLLITFKIWANKLQSVGNYWQMNNKANVQNLIVNHDSNLQLSAQSVFFFVLYITFSTSSDDEKIVKTIVKPMIHISTRTYIVYI